jgi:hypothetical protein
MIRVPLLSLQRLLRTVFIRYSTFLVLMHLSFVIAFVVLPGNDYIIVSLVGDQEGVASLVPNCRHPGL